MKLFIMTGIFFSLISNQVIAADVDSKTEKFTVVSSKKIDIPSSQIMALLANLENRSADDNGSPQIHTTGDGVKIVLINSEAIVAIQAFRLSYAGSKNAYCKLAVKNLKSNKIDIISAPERIELDHCGGLSKPVLVDLNSDNFPDLIFKTQAKSNKGNFDVSQYLVFLSTNTSTELSGVSYCHSTSVSQFLSEEIPFNAAQISLAIKKENARRKIEIQRCDLQ